MTICGRSVKDLTTIVKRNLTKYSADPLLRVRGTVLSVVAVLAPAPQRRERVRPRDTDQERNLSDLLIHVTT